MRVLSWNLFHGRAVPPAGRPLLGEFAPALAGWEWDIALLQEVPPWWPPQLACVAGARGHQVLTSRNWLPGLRRAIAERDPDLIRSNGGGANAILVRGHAIEAVHAQRLRLLPERRVAHAVALLGGPLVVNLHASARPPALAAADLERARSAALRWAGGRAIVLGGDLNLRHDVQIRGFERLASRDVDHLFVRGLTLEGKAHVLDRGDLSDHPPLAVDVAPASGEGL